MNKMLVTYFSVSGTTKNVALEIAKKTNSKIYQINPLIPLQTMT